jgi:uncharacterized protein (UPF0332 family)
MTQFPEVRLYLERAHRALEIAESLLAQGYAGDAASKAYYAMFYAARACLKTEGVVVSEPPAVETAFGHYFARRGRLDPRFHRALKMARDVREIADYSIEKEVLATTARQTIDDGRAFLAAVEGLLGPP